MKTFYVSSPRFDSAHAYIQALENAGFVRLDRMGRADLVLIEHEPINDDKRARFERMVAGKTVFIYPHTPYAYWLWDRWVEPSDSVTCNFVVGEGAKRGMSSYGYPCRVEVCGFPRCEVKPFKPTKGRNLLYSSARLLGGKWPHPGDREMHLRAMAWIIKNRKAFNRVMVNYSESLEANCLNGLDGNDIDFVYLDKLSTHTAMKQFVGNDIVISCNTFGYLAIANGIPTVLYGFEHGAPHRSSTGFGLHYQAYRSHYDFPLHLEEMTADDVLGLRHTTNPQVEEWKRLNIGESFNAEKFISVVREFV